MSRKTPMKRPVRKTSVGKPPVQKTSAPARHAPPRSNDPLLVIDGDSFAHRAYHALPKTLRMKGDVGAGAVIVGWDTLEEPTYRQELLPAYQGGREFDDDLLDQLALLPEFVAACGFANGKAAGFEADDFLAAAVAREEKRGGICVVASGDRDAFQLVSERTIVVFPQRGGEMAQIGPAQVRERYGVDPKQVPDFIALRGDPSDKIPGARGIGAVGAASLLQRYGSLEAAIKAGRFPKEADTLLTYKRIATMDASAPLPVLKDRKPTWSKAADWAQAHELDALAKRLRAMA
jgi:DNA polymerase-1